MNAKRIFIFIIMIFFISVLYAEDVRIACVGNSITSGASNPKTDPNTYSAQLDVLLGEGFDVQNFGVSGRTLLKNGDFPWWDEQAFTDALEFLPNIVTILLGTNDSKPQCWEFKDEFVPDYNAMIDTFLTLPSNPEIIICLPPPAFSVQWDIRDSIITTDIIPMLKQIAQDRQIRVIDFYTAFEDKRALFPDDIHPNTEGSLQMAKIYYQTLTGKTFTYLQDENVALNKTVNTSQSISLPEFLVDGDFLFPWEFQGLPLMFVLDLGEIYSVDQFRTYFGADYVTASPQYTIDVSNDNISWQPIVDRTARLDTLAQVAVDNVDAVETRYVRLTVTGYAFGELTAGSILEFQVMKTAPLHAPVFQFKVTDIRTKYVRVDVEIKPSSDIGEAYMLYSTSDPLTPMTVSGGFKAFSETATRATVRPDQVKWYWAKVYSDGVEVSASDTLKLNWTLSSVEGPEHQTPEKLFLAQNYPNPFNPATQITYSLPYDSQVSLVIYNIRGERVYTLVNKRMLKGNYTVLWNGIDNTGNAVPSGLYFYNLVTGTSNMTRRMILLK